ncbi:MAG: SEC-C domain-containing protein, partial [Thermomicrobiales bacterium]|nr:SEC-C domain-containing protein [Thermomicrobiales bacterium]
MSAIPPAQMGPPMTKPGRNDPCPCGSGKKFKHCHLGKADDVWSRPEPAIQSDPVTGYPGYPTHSGLEVDPALFEADEDEYWEDAVDNLPPPPPYTKLDEAWEVVDEAWYEPNPKKRAKLAKEAIELSSDCCGAYVILAGLETSLDARLAKFEQASTAAERALAPRTLADIARNDQTSPDVEHALYALLHRAITLVALRRSDEGIALLQHMIEVDPSDRYDARLQLVLLLMADEQLDAAAEVERVSTRASSSSSIWAFARALLKFQREGDSVFARRTLAEAIILYPEETEVFRNAFDAMADLGSTETSGSDHPDPVHTRVYQELVRELSLLLSMDGAPLDPVDDRATLVAIAASTA